MIMIANPLYGHEGRRWMNRWCFKLYFAWDSQDGVSSDD